MIVDFVSADYGWLSSSDGSLTAHVGLKPGANHDGYFGNDQVLAQVKTAIQLAKETYPDDEHIFIFDNACTHASMLMMLSLLVASPSTPQSLAQTGCSR